jgi:hypothetical protein
LPNYWLGGCTCSFVSKHVVGDAALLSVGGGDALGDASLSKLDGVAVRIRASNAASTVSLEHRGRRGPATRESRSNHLKVALTEVDRDREARLSQPPFVKWELHLIFTGTQIKPALLKDEKPGQRHVRSSFLSDRKANHVSVELK